MRAIVAQEAGRLAIEDLPIPQTNPGNAVVKLSAAALNRRDVFIWQGRYAQLKYPVVLGSDGAGIVASTGAFDDEHWVGREVIINPSLGWGDNPRAQNPDTFTILGMPDDGTFAEYVRIPTVNLAAKPEHLTMIEAAALPLAGLTAFRAVTTQGKAQAGERVLVTGIGGGAASFALQYAKAIGAHVFVTSSSEDKLARAAELGADGGINYRSEGWVKRAQELAGGPFDLIIDSAGGAAFNDITDAAAPGGRIVFFGMTLGNVPDFIGRRVYWKQLTVQGTTMGSPEDFANMIKFVGEHKIVPVIDDVIPLDRAQEAFTKMEQSEQFGKLVFEM